MKGALRRYAERLDAMTLRERVMVFSALALLVVGVAYSFFIDAEFVRSTRLTHQIAQRQGESKAAQDELTRLARSRQADPDREQRERIAQLRAQLADVEGKVAAEERKFTAATQMRRVIDEMLARNSRVRLVDLKTLPVTTIAEARAARGTAAAVDPKAPTAAEKLIYRHGLELSVSGSYLDLLGYLAELERLPTQLYWSNVELNVDAYPTVRMKVIVFTLSIDRAWMSV
jgi:MSHA biogenesis protein MshJ